MVAETSSVTAVLLSLETHRTLVKAWAKFKVQAVGDPVPVCISPDVSFPTTLGEVPQVPIVVAPLAEPKTKCPLESIVIAEVPVEEATENRLIVVLAEFPTISNRALV